MSPAARRLEKQSYVEMARRLPWCNYAGPVSVLGQVGRSRRSHTGCRAGEGGLVNLASLCAPPRQVKGFTRALVASIS